MPSRFDFFSGPGERPFTPRLARLARGVAGLAALTLFVAAAGLPAREVARAGELDAVYARHGNNMPVITNDGDLAVYEGDPGEPAVDCAGLAGPRTMVALVFGQSNAANTVDRGYDATLPVYSWHDGQCKRVHDALPGASSANGSTWSRLGDRIVTSGLYDAVLFVDIARGGSSILNWGAKGGLRALLVETLGALRENGLAPTHVFFHQGEADCYLGLSGKEYASVLQDVLGEVRSRVGEGCDIFVSRASLFLDPVCGDRQSPVCYKSCPAIVAAQTAAADPGTRIFSGPNTDLLVPWFDRNDGYHFTSRAADRFAAAWMPLLVRGETSVPTLH
uniref:Uncharacterized protein n=1 Tax=Desulfovibrio sp. U5L TaxID=596152 RepID=I2Q2H4_9BACT